MGLYENVRKVCNDRGTSVNALEEKLGYARGTIAKWNEHLPSVGRVKTLADTLNVSVVTIIDGVDFPDEKAKMRD